MRNTATLAGAGRLREIDEMWMPCEDRRPYPYLMYGGASRPEQGATDRDFSQSTGRHPEQHGHFSFFVLKQPPLF
jgi:hypothetical protein